jgi:hypothetical protein
MYYVFSTQRKFTLAAANRINRAIRFIDPKATFIGPVTGNGTTGWIERPNDGTNDMNHVRARNEKMAAIARKEIYGVEENDE